MKMRRGTKFSFAGLLIGLCLLFVFGGLLSLSAIHSAEDVAASTQVDSVNLIRAQATITGTVTVTPTATITQVVTNTPEATVTPVPTVNSPLNTPTSTATPTPTATFIPSDTPTGTPTFTPTPVVTLAPTETAVSAPALLSFKSDPASIAVGNTVELNWEIIGASAITLTYDDVQEVIGIDSTSFMHTPLVTTTYTLTLRNPGGMVSRKVTVGVSANAPDAFASPLEQPAFNSPLDPPAFDSPLNLPTETPTEIPQTPTMAPSPTETATSTFTPTPLPSRTFTPTPRRTATAQPIGLTLTPLKPGNTTDGTISVDGLLNWDAEIETTRSERLRYVWYYILFSICVLLPLLLIALALLFWLVGSRRERERRVLFEE